jgi:hypothetical protein
MKKYKVSIIFKSSSGADCRHNIEVPANSRSEVESEARKKAFKDYRDVNDLKVLKVEEL